MAHNLGIDKTFVASMLFCFLLIYVQVTSANHKDHSFNQKLEVQKLLKKLNKPAVKSIKSPDGDVIDCVSIHNQPALDHPKLKNHKIEMRPSSYPDGAMLENLDVASKSKTVVQPWHHSGSCPKGTIPIRRIKEEDILRANSIQQFGKKDIRAFPELATAYVRGKRFYGAKATINAWSPYVRSGEYTTSQIWIYNSGDKENTNSLEVGWQVHPQLYGDYRTRLFTHWTGYNDTGCYDLLCSGFIQTGSRMTLGGVITPLSTYGSSQFDINVMIWKDIKNGNWWLKYGDNVVGYWPPGLFNELLNATVVQWGGQVVNTQPAGQSTTTQLGSGHFPEEGFGKASYFSRINVVNDRNQLGAPNNILTTVDRSKCYNIRQVRGLFFFGGPGRNPDCP